MNRSAASRTPVPLPPFLAAVIHSTVSAPNTNGEFVVDPSVPRWPETLESRPLDIGARPSIFGLVPGTLLLTSSRTSPVVLPRHGPPQRKSGRLRVVVSTLSHCVFLGPWRTTWWAPTKCRTGLQNSFCRSFATCWLLCLLAFCCGCLVETLDFWWIRRPGPGGIRVCWRALPSANYTPRVGLEVSRPGDRGVNQAGAGPKPAELSSVGPCRV